MQKIVAEDGTKCVTDGETCVELAPFEIVEEIEKEHEVKLDYSFEINPKKVHPGDKLKIEGHFEAPENTGDYQLNLDIMTQGHSHAFPNVAQFTVKKEDGNGEEWIKGDEINKILEKHFKKVDQKTSHADTKYLRVKSNAELMGVVSKYEVHKKLVYEQPYLDCDDFAIALWGAFHLEGRPFTAYPIFYIWVTFERNGNTYGHALNCFVDEHKKAKLIEPQNGKLMKIPEDWKLWKVVS